MLQHQGKAGTDEIVLVIGGPPQKINNRAENELNPSITDAVIVLRSCRPAYGVLLLVML